MSFAKPNGLLAPLLYSTAKYAKYVWMIIRFALKETAKHEWGKMLTCDTKRYDKSGTKKKKKNPPLYNRVFPGTK